MPFNIGDKVRVRVGFARANLHMGVEYTIEAVGFRHGGANCVTLVECKNPHIDDGSWMEERFELVAPAIIPAARFKAGDVVVCIRDDGIRHAGLVNGGEYVVDAFPSVRIPRHGEARIDIRVGGEVRAFRTDRFKLKNVPVVAPPAPVVPLEIKVGGWVKVVDDGGVALNNGEEFQVIEIDDLDGTMRVEGKNNWYLTTRFIAIPAPAPIPFDLEAWKPKAGDMVLVVARDMYTTERMAHYVNDGIPKKLVKVVADEQGRGQTSCYMYLPELARDIPFFFLKESLRPAVGYKAPVEPPKPPEPADVPDIEHPAHLKPVPAYVPPKVPAAPNSDLREKLHAEVEADGYSGLCSFAHEGADGRQMFYAGAPCHARMNTGYWDDEGLKGELTVVAYSLRHDIYEYGKKEEDFLFWTDYIINRSPFAGAFITKDIKEAAEKDIFMNVEVNKYQILGGAVAIRSGQEYRDRPELFKMLVEAGVGEHAAWLGACAFQPYKDDYTFFPWGGGHDVIDRNRDLAEVIKFFREGYHNALGKHDQPYRVDHGNYKIADAVAKLNGKNTIGAWLEANTDKVVKGEGWNKQTIIKKNAVIRAAKKLDQLINWTE